MAEATFAVGMFCAKGFSGYRNQNRFWRLNHILKLFETFNRLHNNDFSCFLVAEYAFDAPPFDDSADPSLDTYRKIIANFVDKVPESCIFIPGTIFVPKSSSIAQKVINKVVPRDDNRPRAVTRATIWRGNTMRIYDKQDESTACGKHLIVSGEGGQKVFNLSVPGVGTANFGLDICKEHAGKGALTSAVDVHMLIADGRQRIQQEDKSRQYFLQCNTDAGNSGKVFKSSTGDSITPHTQTQDGSFFWKDLILNV